RFVLSIALIVSLFKLQAQCDPPGELPSFNCMMAPLTCLNNACYSTDEHQLEGMPNFCGANTIINNPQYFAIIPIEPCIEIHIFVNICEQGSTGLQSALVTSCGWMPCPGGVVPCNDVLDC